MIFVYVLAAWGCLATVSLVVDSIAMYRSLTGRYGESVLTATRDAAERAGGVPAWVVSSLVLDMAMPWVTFQGLLIAYRGRRS
jgi:hypothetical protein